MGQRHSHKTKTPNTPCPHLVMTLLENKELVVCVFTKLSVQGKGSKVFNQVGLGEGLTSKQNQ